MIVPMTPNDNNVVPLSCDGNGVVPLTPDESRVVPLSCDGNGVVPLTPDESRVVPLAVSEEFMKGAEIEAQTPITVGWDTSDGWCVWRLFRRRSRR